MEEILNRRDIIIVSFPYPDQTGSKQRPALVLSSDEFNRSSYDVIICGITCYDDGDPNLIAIKKEDWANGLWSESYANPAYLASMDKRLVIKRIGRLRPEKHAEVKERLGKLLGIKG